MASDNENVLLENSGRRTRSGRQVSTPAAPTIPRATRRTSKRQTTSEHEDENDLTNAQSDLVSAAMSEADQDIAGEALEETAAYSSEAQRTSQLDELDIEMSGAADTGVDEKSSSFPFDTVEHSETSDDAKEITVESSLLASLAGDNANSLPSVGGNDEIVDNKSSTDFDANMDIEKCEKMNSSDDSLSEPAIAEDLVENADGSSATIVNTEIISEDELPLPSKPEINDAEEVSDEELPAPQRAELPADAEVISEDELPNNNNVTDSKLTAEQSTRHKRKANFDETATTKEISSKEVSKSETTRKPVEQYNPMSPTSESNDSPPQEKKQKVEEPEHKEKKKEKEREKDKEKEKDREKDKDKEKERKKLPELDKYWRIVKDDPADFTGWTYLLQYVDNESDAEAAREAYDTFLGHYPYCYGYWRKYADYEKRKGIKANCYAVFERGLQAIPLSVDLWIHYLSHVKANHPEEEEFIRKQFERAVAACGLEFRSDKLWDTYLRWEMDGKRYHRVVHIYDRLLAIPTQTYSGHFDNFQDLINQHSITCLISNEELYRIRKELHERNTSPRLTTSKSSRSRRDSAGKDKDRDRDRDEKKEKSRSESPTGGKSPKDTNENNDDAANSTNLNDSGETQLKAPKVDLSNPSTLSEDEISAIKDKVISIRRKIHKLTVSAVTARWTFEEGIKRPYFHVKPLERAQLKNWKDYLDFEIEKGDRKRVLVLFERCLIACALYDEFWLKMIRYLESISDDQADIVTIQRDVFRRACQIHHPDKPSLHLLWAGFEECQNNFEAAAEVLNNIEKKCPNLLQIAYRRINVERRRGDLEKCRQLYIHYIDTAKSKAIAGSLAIKYARFLNKICNDLEGGLQVLQQNLDKDPNNTRVALQMIDLALQRPLVNEKEIVSIMDNFMERENIEPDQKVLFAQRKVEFLEDFGSTAKGLQDAQRALQIALNKANEAKKKRDSSPSRKSSTANKDSASTASSSTQSAYNNGASTANVNYNYGSANSSAYYQPNSGAYQQPSYDSYYSQWQYGSTGTNNNNSSGYNYSQWGGYGGNYY